MESEGKRGQKSIGVSNTNGDDIKVIIGGLETL